MWGSGNSAFVAPASDEGASLLAVFTFMRGASCLSSVSSKGLLSRRTRALESVDDWCDAGDLFPANGVGSGGSMTMSSGPLTISGMSGFRFALFWLGPGNVFSASVSFMTGDCVTSDRFPSLRVGERGGERGICSVFGSGAVIRERCTLRRLLSSGVSDEVA